MPVRPPWWQAWVPQACPQGHPWLPGTVTVHPRQCHCQGDAVWHHVHYCNRCWWEAWPPDHTGPRPESGPMASF